MEDQRPYLFNPTNGRRAPPQVNVHNSKDIGDKLISDFRKKLPTGFHDTLRTPITTMAVTSAPKGKIKPVMVSLETMCLNILNVGQQRGVSVKDMMCYELCSHPPNLIDNRGNLRKSTKAIIVKKLGVGCLSVDVPDQVIIDTSQLFYHSVWPHGGKVPDLVETIKDHLITQYPEVPEKILVFDKHRKGSAKEHERIRRNDDTSEEFDLTITGALPKRNVILQNTHNKRELTRVLRAFTYGDGVETDDDMYSHDEADVTIVSHMLAASCAGKNIIRIKSDDTDVFVLLVYWVYKADVQSQVQLEKWDGTLLNINQTCKNLGSKCLQIIGMHALSGCDTVSYPFGKGKASAISILTDTKKVSSQCDLSSLYTVLGETNAKHCELLECGANFFALLWGMPVGMSMEDVRNKLFSKNKKGIKIMSLPPTSSNVLLHTLRAHLQVMLWKSADKLDPPPQAEDITEYGWIYKEGVPVPLVSKKPIAPETLLDITQCHCKLEGKLCEGKMCSCHKVGVSCTPYCGCEGGETCKNPHTLQIIESISSDNEDIGSNEEIIEDYDEPGCQDWCVEVSDDEEDDSFYEVRSTSGRVVKPPNYLKDFDLNKK